MAHWTPLDLEHLNGIDLYLADNEQNARLVLSGWGIGWHRGEIRWTDPAQHDAPIRFEGDSFEMFFDRLPTEIMFTIDGTPFRFTVPH